MHAGEYSPEYLDYFIFAGACLNQDDLIRVINHEEMHKQFHQAIGDDEWDGDKDHFIIDKLDWEDYI